MAGFVREKAGLGSPPAPFYTNAVESKNNILKQHLGRKLSSLPEFVDKMKSLLTDQYQEVEKAVASCGEYRVSPRYSHLVYDKLKWFKMSVKQRENKVASFMKFRVDSFDCFREERNYLMPLLCGNVQMILLMIVQLLCQLLETLQLLWSKVTLVSSHTMLNHQKQVGFYVMTSVWALNLQRFALTQLLVPSKKITLLIFYVGTKA